MIIAPEKERQPHEYGDADAHPEQHGKNGTRGPAEEYEREGGLGAQRDVVGDRDPHHRGQGDAGMADFLRVQASHRLRHSSHANRLEPVAVCVHGR
ncbi:hypothetical protein [Streptomyces hydrogenans]|uniref:hypothetical protein n=1 Tax=Streptomyces hydrogenans TaxID=1873719 RepID=UPI003817FC01